MKCVFLSRLSRDLQRQSNRKRLKCWVFKVWTREDGNKLKSREIRMNIIYILMASFIKRIVENLTLRLTLVAQADWIASLAPVAGGVIGTAIIRPQLLILGLICLIFIVWSFGWNQPVENIDYFSSILVFYKFDVSNNLEGKIVRRLSLRNFSVEVDANKVHMVILNDPFYICVMNVIKFWSLKVLVYIIYYLVSWCGLKIYFFFYYSL